MLSRRTFVTSAALSVAGAAASPLLAQAQQQRQPQETLTGRPDELPSNPSGGRYRPPQKFGAGGVQMGNGFKITPDDQAEAMLQAAWDAGVRYFDTSPWYGLGLSERRLGHFLDDKNPDDYVISTKVGRLLVPDASFENTAIWHGDLNFNYKYDYSADGVRRSVEDSLQRLGIPKIDIVFIHDLAPSNSDFTQQEYEQHLQTAISGAMPELTKMREEGMIKAWGMGVNDIAPALAAIENADPDVTLLATQYSLVKHEEALNQVFPKYADRGASLIIGAPLMAGFLAGVDRYLYSPGIPQEMVDKRERLRRFALEYNVDLRTAALQFTAAPDVVSATIPGPRNATQVRENVASMKIKIPPEFWEALKQEGLIAQNAPVPA